MYIACWECSDLRAKDFFVTYIWNLLSLFSFLSCRSVIVENLVTANIVIGKSSVIYGHFLDVCRVGCIVLRQVNLEVNRKLTLGTWVNT